MNIRFKTNHSALRKEWRHDDIRVVREVGKKTFFPYSLQRLDGNVWRYVCGYITFGEARAAAVRMVLWLR